MTVIVNGQPAQVEPGQTVAGLLTGLGHPPGGPGIAVARNGEVVPRSAWPTTTLDDNDRLEVLGASQGG
ncbi:MAG TPA: sulfur carrier protein ThiS [Actinomycetota bacterium]|nr:sulfur carrier protein ThiS [Actinomycetota bacterium]